MPRILWKDTVEYKKSDWFLMKTRLWNSNVIGQVALGTMGEEVRFEAPKIIDVNLVENTAPCDKPERICLEKSNFKLTLKDYKKTDFVLDSCDAEKWANLTDNGTLQTMMSDEAIEIEQNYTIAEDIIWLNNINNKVATTTLDLGVDTMFGTISSVLDLTEQLISEVVGQNPRMQRQMIAFGISRQMYTAIKSVYANATDLGSGSMEQEITSGGLNIKSFYILPDEFVTSTNTHALVYPWYSALKAVGCKRAGWSEGQGSEMGEMHYMRDTNFVADLVPLTQTYNEDGSVLTNDFVGVKYVKTVTP